MVMEVEDVCEAAESISTIWREDGEKTALFGA
jgi:hypothetical protein